VGYREFLPPTTLRDLVECAWVADGPPKPVRVLPDGCMDLMRIDGRFIVAGPDTTASVSQRERGNRSWACVFILACFRGYWVYPRRSCAMPGLR
jgi:hypothetical protein